MTIVSARSGAAVLAILRLLSCSPSVYPFVRVGCAPHVCSGMPDDATVTSYQDTFCSPTMTASSIERELQLIYVGGPTVVLEVAGLRLVTDPTFDPAGGDYRTKLYVLHKTQGPAVRPEAIGPVDVVLLSHDHHADNLDLLGRASLSKAKRVITTPAGAERLQGWATRLTPWDKTQIPGAACAPPILTATPARPGAP